MGKIKCSLCEGLIINGRCTGCGMYYREENKRYYLNVRRSDEEPVVLNEEPEHEKKNRLLEEEKKKTQKTIEKYRQSDSAWGKYENIKPKAKAGETKSGKAGSYAAGRQNTVSGKAKGTTKSANKSVGLIFSILIFAGGVAGMLYEKTEDDRAEELYVGEAIADSACEEVYDEETITESFYEENQYAPYSLEVEGEDFTITLTAGTYLVGQDIPEGIYTASTDAQWISLFLTDTDNDIYGGWWMDEYAAETDGEVKYEAYDIRLYQGAEVDVGGDGELTLVTYNAQMDKKADGVRNPLLDEVDEVRVREQALTAGEDFPAGVYDAQIVSGDFVQLIHESANRETRGYSLDSSESYTEAGRRNISLLAGDRIWLNLEMTEGEAEVMLQPAGIIYE